MIKRFISFGLALLLSFSFLFYLPNEKVIADDTKFEDLYTSYVGDNIPISYDLYLNLCNSVRLNVIGSRFERYFVDSDIVIFACNSYDSSSFYVYFCPSSSLSYPFSFQIFSSYLSIIALDSSGSQITPSIDCYRMKFNGNFDDFVFSSIESTQNTSFPLKIKSDNSFYSYGNYSFVPYYFYSSPPKSNELSFTLSPELTLDMDLDSVQNSLTVLVDNPTEKAYDYMLYVSSTPSATALITSLYNMNFVSSSKQWCYTKQTETTVPPDLKEMLVDNAADSINTTTIINTLYPGTSGYLYNLWGSSFKVFSEYMSYKEDTMTFYSLCQTNCPIYLINREDSRSHVIPFSSFNIEMGKTYYFNIIYREHDQTVVGALGSSTTALLAAGNGQYSYPVYDTSQFTSYQNYSSTEFSVTNGIVSNPQKDDLTDFHSVAYYSNPDNSTAYITNDNSVNINNSFNSGSGSGDGGYDPSCSTNYINHGVIYHGCTIYNSPSGSGSGSGSGSIAAPSAPEFDFDTLASGMGNFMDFIKWVGEHIPSVIVTLISAGLAVVIYCRIFGR